MSTIAAVTGTGSQDVQALLAAVVAEWRASGIKVAALLAESHDLPDRSCAAGFLREVGSGAAFPIYLETAPSHTSCHLDAAGVDAACAALLDRIPASDLVVLSKFGKLEAAGSGLVPAFEAAVAAGKPVLTSVSQKHRDAWQAFVPDAASLAADTESLERWRRSLAAG